MRNKKDTQEASGQVIFFPVFHYDVVWKFNRADYSYINLRLLRQAVELCSLFPEFRFGIEDAYQLEEVESLDPELFGKIKRLAAEGRIEVVDGQYLMLDSFLPGGEVLISGIVRGKRYVKEKLGLDVEVGWIADSFGLNAQTPQIYRDAGYRWLAFGRGLDLRRSKSEFWWEGLDGVRILSHYFASRHGYRAGLFAEELEENIAELQNHAATRYILLPCGIGGCPFPERLFRAIEDLNARRNGYEIKIASPREFFQALEREGSKLGVEKGEMYHGDRVFDGVWSTRMWLKSEYFRVRNLLLNAEKFTALAWLLGKPYPKEEFSQAWERVLFLAFHDVVTGTSIDEVYEGVREELDALKATLKPLLDSSLSYFTSRIPDQGRKLVLFNPHSFEVTGYIEAEVDLEDGEDSTDLAVEGAEWELVEEKGGERGLRRARIGLVTKVPPLGYKVHLICSRRSISTGKVISNGSSIENEHFKVEVSPESGRYRILDAEGNEVVREISLELENELGSVYEHRDISRELIGLVGAEGERSPNTPLFKVTGVRVEEGEVCRKISVKEEVYGCFWPYRLKDGLEVEFYRQKLMELEKEARLYRGIPWVEFIIRLRSNFPHVRVRARIDTGIPDGKCVAGTAFGAIEREEEPRDYPLEDWLDYGDRERGVAVFTHGIPGYQMDKGNVFLTLLRSVSLLSHGDKGPVVPVMDALELERDYEFRFAVYPHQGSWRENKIWIKALSFTNPPIASVANGNHSGRRSSRRLPGGEFSLVSLPENVVLSRLKRSEDGTCVVLRCYEASGGPANLRLNLWQGPREILASNVLEEREEPVGQEIKLRPFQIATFRIKF